MRELGLDILKKKECGEERIDFNESYMKYWKQVK